MALAALLRGTRGNAQFTASIATRSATLGSLSLWPITIAELSTYVAQHSLTPSQAFLPVTAHTGEKAKINNVGARVFSVLTSGFREPISSPVGGNERAKQHRLGGCSVGGGVRVAGAGWWGRLQCGTLATDSTVGAVLDDSTASEPGEYEISAPNLSDQVSLVDGLIGEVEEICHAEGDVVEEGTSVVILETHKASLHIKALGHKRMRITRLLVELNQEVKELQPVFRLVPCE